MKSEISSHGPGFQRLIYMLYSQAGRSDKRLRLHCSEVPIGSLQVVQMQASGVFLILLSSLGSSLNPTTN